VRATFHLVPDELWRAADPSIAFKPTSLALEGFVHCTDGEDELVRTANRHYHADPRPLLALTLDLDRIGAPWTVEDATGIYPHIHGPVDRGAVIAVAPMQRSEDGTFLGIGAGSAPSHGR